MTVRKDIKVKDLSKGIEPLIELDPQDFSPLPPPYDKLEDLPGFKRLKEAEKKRMSLISMEFLLVVYPFLNQRKKKRNTWKLL
jgi:hypothetical protein